MADKFYVVEDYNTGDLYGAWTLEDARAFLVKKYMEDFADSFRGYDGGVDGLINTIQGDFHTLMAEPYPYIEDLYYTRPVTMI